MQLKPIQTNLELLPIFPEPLTDLSKIRTDLFKALDDKSRSAAILAQTNTEAITYNCFKYMNLKGTPDCKDIYKDGIKALNDISKISANTVKALNDISRASANAAKAPADIFKAKI